MPNPPTFAIKSLVAQAKISHFSLPWLAWVFHKYSLGWKGGMIVISAMTGAKVENINGNRMLSSTTSIQH